jgi:hypothetical protein
MSDYDDGPVDSYDAAIEAACFEAEEHWDESDEYEGYEGRGISFFGEEAEPLLLEGDEIPTITVDDLREGETLEDRNARLLAQAAEQRDLDAAEERERDKVREGSFELKRKPIDVSLVRTESRPTATLPLSRISTSRTYGEVLLPSGERPALRHNRAALEAFFSEAAEAAGVDVAELVKPIARGRLHEGEQRRRDGLAKTVAEAYAEGATFEDLGSYLKRPTSTIAALKTRGEALLGLAA